MNLSHSQPLRNAVVHKGSQEGGEKENQQRKSVNFELRTRGDGEARAQKWEGTHKMRETR